MKKRTSDETFKKTVLERASETFDLPKDMLLNLPRLFLTGNRELYLENYRGILEYGEDCIVLATPSVRVRIQGSALSIKTIASEELVLEGNLKSVSFEGGA